MDVRTRKTHACRCLAGVLAVLAFGLAMQALADPAWWVSRGVVSTNAATTNDFAAANIGQVKWIATQAKAEMDANLPGGSGSVISNIVASFSSGNAKDYAIVNAGQFKYVAAPFYDRLQALNWPCTLPSGMTTNQSYPWSGSVTQDFAVVNIGQVKYGFSFSVNTPPIVQFISPVANSWKAVLP